MSLQRKTGLITAVLLFWGLVAMTPAAAGCGQAVGFQVLGSGGPTGDGRRASSAYLLWLDGKARVLLDAGGGSFSRFGSAGADLADLEIVLFSHLHADHSSDLPAFIKSAYFSDRKRALPVIGPAGAEPYPAIDTFMRRLFDRQNGAFAYLSGTLEGRDGQFPTPAQVVSRTDTSGPSSVFSDPELRIHALYVEHGPVPALAYRIEARDKVIVYGGDNNGDSAAFVEFAKGADLLVMHMAVDNEPADHARKLHATPTEIGDIAAQAEVRQLLLSHIMPGLESRLDDMQGAVKAAYQKPVIVAEDLACIDFKG